MTETALVRKVVLNLSDSRTGKTAVGLLRTGTLSYILHFEQWTAAISADHCRNYKSCNVFISPTDGGRLRFEAAVPPSMTKMDNKFIEM
jgi:hypothetical protein